jgi:hypothetical protein
VKNLLDLIKMLNKEIPLNVIKKLDFKLLNKSILSDNNKYDFKYIL